VERATRELLTSKGWRGRAKASGVPVDQPVAHVFRFEGEKVDQCHAYFDRAEALKAVGLDQ
jgi:ketosteroid isomerase-like protein